MPENGRIKSQSLSSSTPVPASRRVGQVLLVAGALTITAALPACSVNSSSHGELAVDKRILASCDSSAPPASDVQVDGTGSSASKAITEERMTAIESIVRTTAICSGSLRVTVFSASSAATTALFDGPLPLHGATDNARLKRVSRVVNDAMAKIRKAYKPAVTSLPGGGSDITSQYRLASEWINQADEDFHLHLYLLTDGFQNIGVSLEKHALSKQQVTKLVNKTAVPKLRGASITVAGLGRVASAPPRSEVAESLVAYYDALCRKTGAAQCTSVTDYTPDGQ